jgi:hypothetical protein
MQSIALAVEEARRAAARGAVAFYIRPERVGSAES